MATVVLNGPVTLTDGNAAANGFTATPQGYIIEPGNKVTLDPAASTTLTSSKSVIVCGTLEAKPSALAIKHGVTIKSIENNFGLGGGDFTRANLPPAGDIGLYVLDAGKLDIIGTTKEPWTTVNGNLAKGATAVTVNATPGGNAGNPAGWEAGDELVICPIEPTSVASHWTHFDANPIASMPGSGVINLGPKAGTSSAALTYPHNPVVIPDGHGTMKAEVLNLTRNVTIKGDSASKRIHVYIRSSVAQVTKYCTIWNTGPRPTTVEPKGKGVKGRYGMHFHHCGDGSRGSVVEGVVMRQGGFYGFITHASHGITFTKCIAYDIKNHAVWWDTPFDDPDAPPTEDLAFTDCVFAKVVNDDTAEGSGSESVSGMFLAVNSRRCTATRCRSIGIAGSARSSGFTWPEPKGPPGGPRPGDDGNPEPDPWVLTDCVAHNGQGVGQFIWQNILTGQDTGFIAYYLSAGGLHFGAYNNGIHFTNPVIYATKGPGVRLQVQPSDPLNAASITGAYINCPDANYAVESWEHGHDAGEHYFLFDTCVFKKSKVACIGATKPNNGLPDKIKLLNCTYVGKEFYLISTISPSSLIRVDDSAHGVLELRRKDQPGDYYSAAWNASVNKV